eukprot:scaffold212091_cov41-Prasinocladus_malaysianus.AAC.1
MVGLHRRAIESQLVSQPTPAVSRRGKACVGWPACRQLVAGREKQSMRLVLMTHGDSREARVVRVALNAQAIVVMDRSAMNLRMPSLRIFLGRSSDTPLTVVHELNAQRTGRNRQRVLTMAAYFQDAAEIRYVGVLH